MRRLLQRRPPVGLLVVLAGCGSTDAAKFDPNPGLGSGGSPTAGAAVFSGTDAGGGTGGAVGGASAIPPGLGTDPEGKLFDSPLVSVIPEDELTLPGHVDSNSPSFWHGDFFGIFTSSGAAFLNSGPDYDHLNEQPELSVFKDGNEKLRWIEALHARGPDELFGLYHREDYLHECADRPGFTVPRIGMAKSTDAGFSWQDLGVVLLDENIERTCDATPNTYFVGGVGDPSWVVEGDHAYILYSSYTGSVDNQGIQLARIAVSDLDAPVGKVFRWQGDAFSAPGIGGSGKPVLPAKVSWHEQNSDAFWGPSIHWNTYLRAHVVILNRTKSPYWDQEGSYLAFIPDLNKPGGWTEPQKIVDGGGWYTQIIGDPAMKGTDSLAGQSSRLFQRGWSGSRLVFEKQ